MFEEEIEYLNNITNQHEEDDLDKENLFQGMKHNPRDGALSTLTNVSESV